MFLLVISSHQLLPLFFIPSLALKLITVKYLNAVVNVVKTSTGGKNVEQFANRFIEEVTIYQPVVLLIDYDLNDRKMGLNRAKIAWEKMIKMALDKKIKLVTSVR